MQGLAYSDHEPSYNILLFKGVLFLDNIPYLVVAKSGFEPPQQMWPILLNTYPKPGEKIGTRTR